VWDATTFTKNRDRLLERDGTGKFLAAVLSNDKVKGLLSSDHFSVDGTLLEAWPAPRAPGSMTARANRPVRDATTSGIFTASSEPMTPTARRRPRRRAAISRLTEECGVARREARWADRCLTSQHSKY
jgi:hypothetical protein